MPNSFQRGSSRVGELEIHPEFWRVDMAVQFEEAVGIDHGGLSKTTGRETAAERSIF